MAKTKEEIENDLKLLEEVKVLLDVKNWNDFAEKTNISISTINTWKKAGIPENTMGCNYLRLILENNELKQQISEKEKEVEENKLYKQLVETLKQIQKLEQ